MSKLQDLFPISDTAVREHNGIPYMFGNLWTSKQRQGHPLHEISYRACFKSELPEFILKYLGYPGRSWDSNYVVYDPFMGRGTTVIEAAIHGFPVIGNDINPVSKRITYPRLQHITYEEIESRVDSIDWDEAVDITNPELTIFFHEKTLRQIEIVRKLPLGDLVASWIFMVAMSRLSGHSTGFFSVRTMPPNQTISLLAQHRLNKSLGLTPSFRDVPSLIKRKAKSLLRAGSIQSNSYVLLTGPATSTPYVAYRSVNLVITSPPFLDVVDYAQDNWLRLWFMGIDPKEVSFTILSNLEEWRNFMLGTFAELARVVKPGGYIAFEVGEVRGGKLQLEREIWDVVEGLPFERIGVLVNVQNFTKTSNCWGVNNMVKGTNTNRIVILRRQ